MASLNHALHRIRRARRAEAPPPTQHFDTYRESYEVILAEVEQLGGEDCLDTLADSLVEETHETGELPTPERVRELARVTCEAAGVEVPPDSALTE